MVYSLVNNNSVAHVNSFVSAEMPLDTGASFQAAQTTTKVIMYSMFKIGFLESITFLSFQDKLVQIGDHDDLLNRPEDIPFFKLRCTMDD